MNLKAFQGPDATSKDTMGDSIVRSVLRMETLAPVAAALAAALLAMSNLGLGERSLTEGQMGELLNNVYRGEKHVDVDSLEFGEAVSDVVEQYKRGYSEGFSLGPVMHEWLGNLNPRILGTLRSHPAVRGQKQFWDLGCGTGENLLKAFITSNQDVATEWIGVERMSDRYELAANALNGLSEQAQKPGRIGELLRAKLGLDGSFTASPSQPPQILPSVLQGWSKRAKCIGVYEKGQICVAEGDIMDIRDFSHARVVFLNIDDPYQLVTHRLLSGHLQETIMPNTAMLVSYPLKDEDRRDWTPQAEHFEVVQDWDGDMKDNAAWSHSLYRRERSPSGS